VGGRSAPGWLGSRSGVHRQHRFCKRSRGSHAHALHRAPPRTRPQAAPRAQPFLTSGAGAFHDAVDLALLSPGSYQTATLSGRGAWRLLARPSGGHPTPIVPREASESPRPAPSLPSRPLAARCAFVSGPVAHRCQRLAPPCAPAAMQGPHPFAPAAGCRCRAPLPRHTTSLRGSAGRALSAAPPCPLPLPCAPGQSARRCVTGCCCPAMMPHSEGCREATAGAPGLEPGAMGGRARGAARPAAQPGHGAPQISYCHPPHASSLPRAGAEPHLVKSTAEQRPRRRRARPRGTAQRPAARPSAPHAAAAAAGRRSRNEPTPPPFGCRLRQGSVSRALNIHALAPLRHSLRPSPPVPPPPLIRPPSPAPQVAAGTLAMLLRFPAARRRRLPWREPARDPL
jgi:hypothetical protein